MPNATMTDLNISSLHRDNASAGSALSNRVDEVTQPASKAAAGLVLDNIVRAICLDARNDALRYALRSNVSHDGE